MTRWLHCDRYVGATKSRPREELLVDKAAPFDLGARQRRLARKVVGHCSFRLAWINRQPQKTTTLASQLIERYGVLTREMVASEGIAGGFSGVYPILKAMEEAGRIRRGYFVAGLGAAQFAAAGAEDRLRDCERTANLDEKEKDDELLILAATDPANPYGSALRWPVTSCGTRPHASPVQGVLQHRGELLGYLGRTGQSLLTFLPNEEPERSNTIENLMKCFALLSEAREVAYLTKVDGGAPQDSAINDAMQEAGFVPSAKGYLLRAKK